MNHYKDQILACDFFTVDTVFLQKFYVLFFIELGSCQVYFAGVTTNPNQIWVTQQARQLVWVLSDREKPLRLVVSRTNFIGEVKKRAMYCIIAGG